MGTRSLARPLKSLCGLESLSASDHPWTACCSGVKTCVAGVVGSTGGELVVADSVGIVETLDGDSVGVEATLLGSGVSVVVDRTSVVEAVAESVGMAVVGEAGGGE